MSVYVFCGSTLPAARAREHLDAHYLPPVEQGSVLRILPDRPRVIGIIDGLFGAVPAVWHKEILLALEQGCHVFGASSMGALRAAELHSFGMRGVGRIFESFRDGTLEDDDEVAVAHASAEHGFRELSVAMVNVRDMLEEAERIALLDGDFARALLAHAKSRPYPSRTTADLVFQAKQWGWSAPKVERLAEFLRSYGTTRRMLKERDAIAMLGEIRDFVATDPAPFAGAVKVERTVFIHELQLALEAERAPRRTIDHATSHAETGLPLFALRKEALIQLLARDVAQRLELDVTGAELETAWSQLRQGAGFTAEGAEAAWLVKSGMTVASVTARLRDIITLQKVEAHFSRRVDVELPDLAAILGAVREAP